ncbi:MAG: two-component regulator propeller domain-containing protein, partial [Bacteroidota bacterium]
FRKSDNTANVTSFIQSNQGILIGTYGNGVYALQQNNIQHFTQENGLSDNVIYSMAADELNNVWCGTDAGINEIIDPFGKAKFDLFANKNGLPDNIVRHLKLINNKLLVSMQDSGICFIDINQNRIERLPFIKDWKEGTILQADQIDKNKFIMVTEKKGLYQIINGIFYHYNYDELTQSSSINSVYIDHTKQIWLAGKKGLSQYAEKRFNVINKAKGLSEEKILALAVDDNNNVWIGTTMGISKIENIEGGDLKETKIQDLDKFTISSATKAPDGNIWFGTYGNGIVIMSAESSHNVVLNSKDDQLPNDNISSIYFANDTTVFVSTLGGGLIKVHVELNGNAKLFKVVKNYTQAKDGLGNDYVYNVITDRNGKLFVATDGGGLDVLEKGKFVDLAKKHRLRSNTFYSLCCDKNNNIWASSNVEGIIKYDGTKIQIFNQKNGIRDLQPQQMLVLKDYLYLINSKGIDKINIETGEVSYCDLIDKDFEPNLNAVYKFRNKILFGTNLGILVYRTDKTKLDSIKPRALITTLLINYKPQSIDSMFEFQYTQNNVSLSFKGVWLKNPEKLYFRYRLNGMEVDWLYSDEAKVVNYNNLVLAITTL